MNARKSCAMRRRRKGYRVKDLQINAGGGAQPRMYAAQRAGVAASVAPPSVEPGASTIQVNVNGTVQLQ